MFQVPKGVQLLAKAVLNAAYLVLGYVGCSLAWSTPSYMRAFATWAAEISAKKLYNAIYIYYNIIYIYIKHYKAIKWVAEGGELWFHGPTSKSQHSLLTQPRIQARNPSQCKDHGVHSHHAPLDLDWMQCSLTCEHRDQSNLGIAGTWLSKYLPCMSTTKILKSDWRQVKRKRVKCKGTYVKICQNIDRLDFLTLDLGCKGCCNDSFDSNLGFQRARPSGNPQGKFSRICLDLSFWRQGFFARDRSRVFFLRFLKYCNALHNFVVCHIWIHTVCLYNSLCLSMFCVRELRRPGHFLEWSSASWSSVCARNSSAKSTRPLQGYSWLVTIHTPTLMPLPDLPDPGTCICNMLPACLTSKFPTQSLMRRCWRRELWHFSPETFLDTSLNSRHQRRQFHHISSTYCNMLISQNHLQAKQAKY